MKENGPVHPSSFQACEVFHAFAFLDWTATASIDPRTVGIKSGLPEVLGQLRNLIRKGSLELIDPVGVENPLIESKALEWFVDVVKSTVEQVGGWLGLATDFHLECTHQPSAFADFLGKALHGGKSRRGRASTVRSQDGDVDLAEERPR